MPSGTECRGAKAQERKGREVQIQVPPRGSASGKGKSGYMVAHTVFLARDVPQEVFRIIAGILDTVALKRPKSLFVWNSLCRTIRRAAQLQALHRMTAGFFADALFLAGNVSRQ